MSEVISKGILVNQSKSSRYSDTILSTFISNSGPYELEKISGSEFSTKYSSSMDSISWRTTQLLADSEYDILALRHRPWTNNIYVDEDSSLVNDQYELVLTNIKIEDLMYLILSNDQGSTALWRSTDTYKNSIPSVVRYTDRYVFYGSNLDDYYETTRQKSSYLNIFTEKISNNSWKFISDSRFHIRYGCDNPTDDRTSIRIFEDYSQTVSDYLSGNAIAVRNLPGTVEYLNTEYLRIHINNSDPVDIPIPEDTYIVPKDGESVTIDSVLFTRDSYSYPEMGKDYSGTISFDIKSLDPILGSFDSILAGPEDSGIVTAASDMYVKIYGKSTPIYNTQLDRLICVVKVGQFIEVGDPIFVMDPNKLVFDKLNPLTYASYLELPTRDYVDLDYFYINTGSRTYLIVFTDRNIDSHTKEHIESKFSISDYDEIIYVRLEDSKISINKRFAQVLTNLAFIVNYDIDTNIIYLKRTSPYLIKNISSCIYMKLWSIGLYDMTCMMYDERKILSAYSKYPNSSDKITLTISTNSVNFSSSQLGYNLQVSRYSGVNLIESEEFIFDLSEDGPFTYHKINSNIIELVIHNKKVIQPGTYTLRRGIKRDVSVEMKVSNIDNLVISNVDYEVFVDGGDPDDFYREFLWNKLKSHENLLLFTLDEEYFNSNTFPLDYNKYINSGFSSPYIMYGDYVYPIYAYWLKLVKLTNYTGEINVDRLVGNFPQNYKDRLMTVDYDGYRYVLTHNYVKSYISNGSLIFPESLLILSRIRSSIYHMIDYQRGESSIRDQFTQLTQYLMITSKGALLNITLDSIKITDRTCIMSVSIYLNNFRVDPINLLVKININ